jgi:hypothetical protein
VGSIIVFLVAYLLIWSRKWLTETKLGMDGKFAKQRAAMSDMEMNTVQPSQRMKSPVF